MVHKNALKDIFYRRSRLVTAFFLLLFAIIVFKLFNLQIIQGKATRQLAEGQHIIYKKLLPSRGEIKLLDKNNEETFTVATNIKQYLVYAVPQEIQRPTLVAESLASVLGMNAKDILAKIESQDKKYVPIKKQLSDTEQEKIKGLDLPGIYFDEEGARFYPSKSFLSQTLGFVGFKGDQKVGLYGLEKSFEKELAGKPGELREEKGGTGAWIFGSKREFVSAEDGVSLILTVDKTIQFKAESLLKDTVEKNGADGGSIIVADPKTGAILAVANYPDYNLNEYNKVEDHKFFLSQAMTGNYEPGSIFKPITMAAAINEGKVTPDTTYNDLGEVVIDGHHIKNSDNKAHGIQTMTQVLELSLNTGAIFAKEQIGNQKFLEYVKKFGFGKATGIELPQGVGNLGNLKANILTNFHTASFGQGISVTPIQLVQAFTAIANNGKMMQPYLVQYKISADGSSLKTEPKVVDEVISAKTANTVAAMMVNVVENGHGKKAKVPGFYIAGKTGTAQVPRLDGKGYETDNNIGSFIGFGPVEDPKFLALVRVDHPRDVNFAESTAAPAFGQLAQFILNYYQVPPNRDLGK